MATVGLGLPSNSADLCCFCSLSYCAPQTEASNGGLRSHHQGIWVASVLVVYLQAWQIGGLFPGGTLNCVAKDFVTLVTKYYLSSENAGPWQPSGSRESLECHQPPLITAPPRPLLTAFLSVSSAVNTVLDKNPDDILLQTFLSVGHKRRPCNHKYTPKIRLVHRKRLNSENHNKGKKST